MKKSKKIHIDSKIKQVKKEQNPYLNKQYSYKNQKIIVLKELGVDNWVQIEILEGKNKNCRMPVEISDLKGE